MVINIFTRIRTREPSRFTGRVITNYANRPLTVCRKTYLFNEVKKYTDGIITYRARNIGGEASRKSRRCPSVILTLNLNI